MRDTVKDFYRRFKGGEEGTPSSLFEVCPAQDIYSEQLIQQNAQLKQACGAVQLEVLKTALEDARAFLDVLLDIFYDILKISMGMMQLSGAGGQQTESFRETILQDILFWFHKLIVHMGEALKALGTLVYKMIFESSPVGKVLKNIIKIICEIVVWYVNNIWKKFWCVIMEITIPPMLNMIIGFLRFIDAVVQVNPLGDAHEGIR